MGCIKVPQFSVGEGYSCRQYSICKVEVALKEAKFLCVRPGECGDPKESLKVRVCVA
jgi:hypothetical protein